MGKCRETFRQVEISHLQKIHLYCFSGGVKEIASVEKPVLQALSWVYQTGE